MNTLDQRTVIAVASGVVIGFLIGVLIFNVGIGIPFAIFGGALGYAYMLYTRDRS